MVVTEALFCAPFSGCVLWFIFRSFVLVSSGRLIRTFADVQYGNYHLTVVEIIYNVISLIVAIVTTVAFTIYTKRALDELQSAKTNAQASSADHSNFELGKLPLERPKLLGFSSSLS